MPASPATSTCSLSLGGSRRTRGRAATEAQMAGSSAHGDPGRVQRRQARRMGRRRCSNRSGSSRSGWTRRWSRCGGRQRRWRLATGCCSWSRSRAALADGRRRRCDSSSKGVHASAGEACWSPAWLLLRGLCVRCGAWRTLALVAGQPCTLPCRPAPAPPLPLASSRSSVSALLQAATGGLGPGRLRGIRAGTRGGVRRHGAWRPAVRPAPNAE